LQLVEIKGFTIRQIGRCFARLVLILKVSLLTTQRIKICFENSFTVEMDVKSKKRRGGGSFTALGLKT
jgi:hypothetical protein